MTYTAFALRIVKNFAFFALLIATFCVTSVSAQNGGVSKDSKRVTNSKYEAKERRNRELRNLKLYTPKAIKRAQKGPTVKLEMKFYGESEPLSSLVAKQTEVTKENGPIQEDEMEPLFEVPEKPSGDLAPALPVFLQNDTTLPFAPIGGASFEGPGTGLPGFSLTGAPPDTTMAVGPSHIVAWVNSQYAVFNKTGTLLLGPINGNTLFAGVGGNCDTTNRGDPILQYDRLANRWILSQFAFSTSGSNAIAPYFQCFAVSTTGDPTGTYVRYTVAFSATSPSGLNDYGKLGIWNDGYYAAYNMFGGSPAGSNTGAALCASDRTKMLAGDPSATTLCAPITFYAGGGSFLPADLDGASPPSDLTRGGVFLRLRTGTPRALRIKRLKPNFTAGTVTIDDGYGGVGDSFVNLPVTTTLPCNDSGGTCVAQPGTSNTLDTLGSRLMYRLAYRNRNGIDSMVVTHSEDPDGAGTRSSAIRWYEIRNPLGNPADTDTSKRPFIFQNGTYDPGATGDRWMGSMAMNKYGDILAGYSIANAAALLNPSIAITGRGQSDSLNTLQAEQIAVTGTGSQTGTLTRWGDYSTMQVDPADDQTFWYTTQYLSTDGTFNWRTRIVSYRFPTTTATISGDFNTSGNWTNGIPSSTVSGIVPSGTTLTVNAPTTVANLDVQSGATVTMNANLNVNGALTLGTSINTGSSTLGLGCLATVSGASSSIFVTGNVKKDFCAAGGFNFPVGTANGYSPMYANVTTLTTNPSTLAVQAVQSFRTGMSTTQSLKRYWTIASTGALTTDLTFNYLDPSDVNGTEANYLLYKWNGVTSTSVPFTLDTTANTIKATGISSFSDWTGGTLAPSAATVSVSGRVLTQNGQGVRNATVVLSDLSGNSRTTVTSAFGYFHFDDVVAGASYTVSVIAKRYSFTPRLISPTDDIADIDFTADSQLRR